MQTGDSFDEAPDLDGEGHPERDDFTPEHESDRSTAEYGRADEETRSDG